MAGWQIAHHGGWQTGLIRLAARMGVMMKRNALILLIATLAFGVAPFVTPPFTGYDPSLFPVRIERPSIQPAGYAFAIWSVIYLWLIAHAVFGLWKRAEDPAWDAVRLPLTVAVLVGAVWLSIAGQSPIWGTVTIWIMAGAAILAFLRADYSLTAPSVPFNSGANDDEQMLDRIVQDANSSVWLRSKGFARGIQFSNRWMLSGPTAIFAGWLSAAASVSTGVLIAGYGWLTDTQSAAAMLAVVLVIAVTVQMRRPAMPVYGLTVIWALIGVVVVNWPANITVAVLAGSGIVVMLLTLIASRRTTA